MRWKKTGEEGLLTVEAILGLVPFILVILGIISFIDIFAVHNKIQYAMHQMGNEISAYTYFYEALGIRSADLGLKADADKQSRWIRHWMTSPAFWSRSDNLKMI